MTWPLLAAVVGLEFLPHFLFAKKKHRRVEVGDTLPAVTLYDGKPDNKVDLAALCKGRKVVIIGVPGAFTPTCHKTHLPGFVSDKKALKAKGVDEVVCVSINDPFVMSAWGEALKGEGIRWLADTHGELTAKLGLVYDATAKLGNTRTHRFALVAQDGKVTVLRVEEGGVLTCSRSADLLRDI